MTPPRQNCIYCDADAYPNASGKWECDFGHIYEAAPPDALRMALLAAEWFANDDDTEAFCIICGGDRPQHKTDCTTRIALAATDEVGV